MVAEAEMAARKERRRIGADDPTWPFAALIELVSRRHSILANWDWFIYLIRAQWPWPMVVFIPQCEFRAGLWVGVSIFRLIAFGVSSILLSPRRSVNTW